MKDEVAVGASDIIVLRTTDSTTGIPTSWDHVRIPSPYFHSEVVHVQGCMGCQREVAFSLNFLKNKGITDFGGDKFLHERFELCCFSVGGGGGGGGKGAISGSAYESPYGI